MLFSCDRRIAAAAMILCCILWTATGLALGMSRVHAKTPSDVSQAIWIDEDESGQQGHRSVGSVVWRTTVFSGTPEPSTPVVTGIDPREAVPLAEIEVPDRGVSATWLLRCITDPTFSIPASHLIEIKFKLPKDYWHSNDSWRWRKTNRSVASQHSVGTGRECGRHVDACSDGKAYGHRPQCSVSQGSKVV